MVAAGFRNVIRTLQFQGSGRLGGVEGGGGGGGGGEALNPEP